jgi:predicted thioesterase
MNEPALNSTASALLSVAPGDLASALPLDAQDAFPAVLATARMVALMEIASARVLRHHLAEGELSVGVSVEVTHTAPTPAGAEVTATARYIGREGKLFVFEVIASDAGGEVGRARHKRAIVNTERLQNSARRRVASTAPAQSV